MVMGRNVLCDSCGGGFEQVAACGCTQNLNESMFLMFLMIFEFRRCFRISKSRKIRARKVIFSFWLRRTQLISSKIRSHFEVRRSFRKSRKIRTRKDIFNSSSIDKCSMFDLRKLEFNSMFENISFEIHENLSCIPQSKVQSTKIIHSIIP